MYNLVVFFIILATILGVGVIIYVIIDMLLERREQPEPVVEVVEPIVEPESEPEPIVVEEIIETEEEILERILHERGAGHGKKGEINIGTLDQHFEENEIVTLAILKKKGLIGKKVRRYKVLADGILTKPLIIKAEAYSVEAIKEIELVGGTPILLVD